MLDRTVEMDLNRSSSINIIVFREKLNKEWKHNDELLIWEYGKHHLKKRDKDRLHCCRFALGRNCKHINK